MSLKIFLTADVHLGLKFSGYPTIQKELAEARFETLQSMIKTANDNQCNLFVIAGDLFDHHRVSDVDVERCKNILNEFQGTACLVLPGNHDFFVPGNSLWTRFTQALGDRVLLLDKKEKLNMKSHYGLDVCVYPAPCHAKHSASNNTDWVAAEVKDPSIRFHIGIAHGSMKGVSPDQKGEYFPMDEDVLAHSGLHVWLMGHTDRMQYPASVQPSSKVFYPGTHEPNGFDCTHEGMAWILTLDEERKIHAESIVCGQYAFVIESVQVTSIEDFEPLLAKYSDHGAQKTVLRVLMSGSIPKDDFPKIGDFEKRLQKLVVYTEIDASQLRSEITEEVIRAEFTAGSFPFRLLSKLSEDAADKKALQIAYDLITGVKNEN